MLRLCLIAVLLAPATAALAKDKKASKFCVKKTNGGSYKEPNTLAELRACQRRARSRFYRNKIVSKKDSDRFRAKQKAAYNGYLRRHPDRAAVPRAPRSNTATDRARRRRYKNARKLRKQKYLREKGNRLRQQKKREQAASAPSRVKDHHVREIVQDKKINRNRIKDADEASSRSRTKIHRRGISRKRLKHIRTRYKKK